MVNIITTLSFNNVDEVLNIMIYICDINVTMLLLVLMINALFFMLFEHIHNKSRTIKKIEIRELKSYDK